jgi:hypothetical protein
MTSDLGAFGRVEEGGAVELKGQRVFGVEAKGLLEARGGLLFVG